MLGADGEKLIHEGPVEYALILQVVYGVHRAHTAVIRAFAVLHAQQGYAHGRLPVVSVEHVGEEAYTGHGLQRGLGEEGEALPLVAVALAVYVAPAKVVLVIYEVYRHSLILHGEYAAILAAPAELYIKLAYARHLFPILWAYGGIQGDHHPHVHALPFELLWQRAYNIRQPAGLYEWHALRGQKQHLIWRLLWGLLYFFSYPFLGLGLGFLFLWHLNRTALSDYYGEAVVARKAASLADGAALIQYYIR